MTVAVARAWKVAAVLLCAAGYGVSEQRLSRDREVNAWAPRLTWASALPFESKGLQSAQPGSAVGLSVWVGRLGGWRSLAADLLWLKAMQYLGDPAGKSEGYRQFGPMVRDVVEADPSCVQAYASGAAVLMWVIQDAPAAVELLKAGIRRHPSNGTLALYLAAFTYYRDDQVGRAIGVLETMMADDQHATMLEPILGNLYVKIGQREKARHLWWWMWYHSRSLENRSYAKAHLIQYGYWQQ